MPKRAEEWYGCYGTRGDLFTRESNRHPAKMAVQLCFRIFDHMKMRGWIKPGDLVLDPMAGIFTTGIVGASLAYRVVGVELESHFIDLARANVLHFMGMMPKAPEPEIVQGDARRLREVLGKVDACVSSPPYSESVRGGGIAVNGHFDDPDLANRQYKPDTQSPGGDAVVSSPPYANDAHGHISEKREMELPPGDRCGAALRNMQGYGKGTPQIGNLKDPAGNIDAVLSSPPYGGTHIAEGDDHTEASKGRARWIGRTGHKMAGKGKWGYQYGRDSEGQLANLPDVPGTGDTYLSAMLQVYREVFCVVKPSGVMALVLKNPVKNGKIRRLDEDTIKLCEAVGFKLVERVRAMLREDLGEQMGLNGESTPIRRERKSFFKRLHEKKWPELAVNHEDVLFFQKPVA